ncbi:pyroglutamyl-peptidase I family protein [Nigerium massiliense]|uniref:pyroglutamyl-peptidase I family protein n=1 Tax=Nigerium massiliense TaxID=1522317 RepID=UPI0006946B37|nr:hypothetical protein [Nigerium massiliense]
MPTVVLTGFGPFSGVECNPAREGVLEAGMSLYTDPGVRLVVEILPVEFERARRRLQQLAADVRPDLWLSFGVAANRTAVTPERWGHNVQDARVPDNAGAQPRGTAVEDGGPAKVPATLPNDEIVAALREAGFDAEPSDSAGEFVCNTVLYTALRTLAGSGVPVGFVHLPGAIERPAEAVKTAVRVAIAAR